MLQKNVVDPTHFLGSILGPESAFISHCVFVSAMCTVLGFCHA